MSDDHKFEINYIFNNDPMNDVIDAADEHLEQHVAAHHLIQRHQADLGGGSAPSLDAKPEEILHYATDHGITDIRVSRIHAHPKGDTPGHYKQP
ncbi:hypothetical protein [Stutzerimonas tarimensis]|uniref:Uncharacterized protein n=1 Tax=Stutzerimonas tarimensis TaxID=1507735 RepID=A0ABV7T8J1_9GAMM